MTRVLAVLLACVLLAACSGPAQTADRAPGGADVDVSTPQLRELKAKAGVEGCPAARASSELPEVTLRCLGGGRDVDLSRLRGPLVINLFAQWCGPCREELPYYQALHEKAKGAVRVVGVDYLDTQPSGALRLAAESGVTYPLLADPAGRLRVDLKIRALPGVVLVDADGSVAAVEFRTFRSYAELRALVRSRLGVRVPS